MHRTRFTFAISVLVLIGGIAANAQQGHGAAPTSTSPKPNAATPTAAKPAPPAPHPATAGATPAKKTAPTPPAATASGNKSQAKPAAPPASAPKTAAKSPAATTTAKNDKTSATKDAKAGAKTAKSEKAVDTKVAKTEKKSDKPSKATTTTTAKTSTTTPTTLTPVQEKLKQNTNLAAKLQDRLPKGTDLIAAADGFRNLGQFVAAVNVSNNLNVSFTELKTKLVTNNMSLGQAIQAVRPLTASPTIEAQHAEYEARGMISESEHADASTPAQTHGPVTTPTSSTTPPTSSTAKAKAKTTKTSPQ